MGKRISIFLLIIIVGYVIYYDLTVGTFPNQSLTTISEIDTTPTIQIAYETIEMKSGDTLLSVVEQLSTGVIPSAEKIIADFQSLNGSASPIELTIGKSYRIPVYR